MRPVTRNAVLLILALLVVLLALGALPSFLASGDPFYLTAEAVENRTASGGAEGSINASATVNGSELSERRFPYTTEALRNGTSDPYRKGPWGLKETFTHSPFDERDALAARNGSAVTDDGVLVDYNGTLYSVAVGQRV